MREKKRKSRGEIHLKATNHLQEGIHFPRVRWGPTTTISFAKQLALKKKDLSCGITRSHRNYLTRLFSSTLITGLRNPFKFFTWEIQRGWLARASCTCFSDTTCSTEVGMVAARFGVASSVSWQCYCCGRVGHVRPVLGKTKIPKQPRHDCEYQD